MNDMFDADTFMSSTTTEAGSTTVKPLPAATYTAIVEDVAKPRVITGRDGGTSVVLDVTFKLMDVPPAVAAEIGRQVFTVRSGYFLDVTPSNGLDLSKGKNVQLNKLRAALGQNEQGKPWNINMLKGAGPLKVTTGLRADKNAPDVFYTDVKAVGKM
jgi:hypothetical protein